MGFFDFGGAKNNHEDAYNEYQGTEHKAKVSHELIAGAAAYEAAKAYEQHVKANGEPSSHAQAKEIIAGIAGAFIDREVETRGLDSIDREKAKHEAKKRLENHLEGGY